MDVSGRNVVVAAVLAMAVVCGLDLIDGRLGLAFSIGFVLIAITVPMAIELRSVVVAGVLPPVLLIVALFTVALINPTALTVEGLHRDAGVFARTLAAVLDHGLTLVIGHGLALAAIVLRTTWGARARALTLARS
jgi:hypothetical protein